MSRSADSARIRRCVGSHRARIESAPESPGGEAAVALIFHESPGSASPELLFIERAARDDDPWSGQMAFPGGRRDSGDRDLAETAARETLEEVGVPLPAALGRLDDFSNDGQARRFPEVRRVRVSPFVYELPRRPRPIPNHEVASTVWIPLRWIFDPASASTYLLERDDYRGVFPAFAFRDYKVWGITYRILEGLAEVLGLSLPSTTPYPNDLGGPAQR
ncbi:MAG: CoA pyrophosphatase [Proteobacteria bacterium]|nr:CoA pyrophosphatase [Pseudomonadota bacterium]